MPLLISMAGSYEEQRGADTVVSAIRRLAMRIESGAKPELHEAEGEDTG